ALDRINSKQDGEILMQIAPMNGQPASFTAEKTLNRIHPSFTPHSHDPKEIDTQGCTGCHADTNVTKGPYGSKSFQVNGAKAEALVSPYYRQFDDYGEMTLYCVPQDLEMLRACNCKHEASPACLHLETSHLINMPPPSLSHPIAKMLNEYCDRLD